MKRFLAVLTAAAAMAAAAAPSGAAVGVTRHRGITVTHFDAGNGLWLNVWQQTNLPAGTETVSACANVNTGSGYDYGCGPISLTMDPLGATGTMRGSVLGTAGPITIDLTFLRTQVNTATPWAAAEVIPSPASISALMASSANGRSNGAIGSGIGGFAVTNGPTNVYDSVTASASV